MPDCASAQKDLEMLQGGLSKKKKRRDVFLDTLRIALFIQLVSLQVKYANAQEFSMLPYNSFEKGIISYRNPANIIINRSCPDLGSLFSRISTNIQIKTLITY